MAASVSPVGAAAAGGVGHQLANLVAKYPSDDRQRLELHAALLTDVTSADAWAHVLQHEVRSQQVCNPGQQWVIYWGGPDS